MWLRDLQETATAAAEHRGRENAEAGTDAGTEAAGLDAAEPEAARLGDAGTEAAGPEDTASGPREPEDGEAVTAGPGVSGTGAVAFKNAGGSPEVEADAEPPEAVQAPGEDADAPTGTAATTPDVEDTQVIPLRRPPQQRATDTAVDLEAVDDRPHLIPGFDRYDDEATQVIRTGSDTDRTQVLPQPDGPDVDDTQVIPNSPPPDGGRRLGRTRGTGRSRNRRRR